MFEKKIWLKKNLGFEKMLGPMILWFQKNFGPYRFFVSDKDFRSEINLDPKKFDPNKVWSTKITALKKLVPKSLVNIGPVTADILLIWTHVAWKNVTMTVGSVKDGPRDLPIKFGQNLVSNS